MEVAHLSAVTPGGQLANEHEEDPFFFLSLWLPVSEPVDRGFFGAAELERTASGAGGDVVVGDAAALRSLVGIILRTAQRTPRACVSRSPGRKEEPEGSGGTQRFLLALWRAGCSAAGRFKAKIYIPGKGRSTVYKLRLHYCMFVWF